MFESIVLRIYCLIYKMRNATIVKGRQLTKGVFFLFSFGYVMYFASLSAAQYPWQFILG